MTGRKVYRAPGAVIVPGCIVFACLLVIGLGTAVSSPGAPGKGGTAGAVLGVAVGMCCVLFSLWGGAIVATNGLTVTSAALVHRSSLRSTTIGWPEIESFTVGPGRGRMRWPAVIIVMKNGSRVVTSVASYTARRPAQVARELTDLQADIAAAAPACQDAPAAESD